ncbi:MAG: ABC transporter substrate-binding protein/permease [Bacteriovoracaceae bacterium]|nr:ABC transporter substrate-binding protein/permease [Bacteriovoracaceae bacterium]
MINSIFVIFFSFFLATEILARPQLRWAADAESGAPFVFYNPDNLNEMMGFEYDIVQAVAKEMDYEPVFVQNSWEGLVPGLQRGQYDVIINGIEITEDRKQVILFSDPYFVTFEQIVVRKETDGIESLADMKGKKVGTLRSSLAERILRSEGDIEILGYDAETNAYSDLKLKRSDAVLLDAPIAQYYARPDADLKMIGAPIGQILYGIGIQKENQELQKKINRALKVIIQNGTLREIYDRWSLWNSPMASLFNDFAPSRVPPTQYDFFLRHNGKTRTWKEKALLYWSFIPIMAKGAVTTLNISLVSMALAVALGLILALMRLYGPRPVVWMATIYIEVVRGTPLLIQLFFIFYALPHIGIKLSPFVAAFLGLGLNYAAYEAENYRAGIQGIPRGQTEAAAALGLGKMATLRYVIVPQAMRIVLPPITNDFIALLKDSSLVSVITMVELTKIYGQLASTYYDFIGTGILVALFYLLLGLPFVRLLRYVENRFHAPYGEKGHSLR